MFGGLEYGIHALLRRVRVLKVVGIQHRNYRDRSGRVLARPLALDKAELDGVPVLSVGDVGGSSDAFSRCGVRALMMLRKGRELFQVDTHLVDELGDRHLLRSGELVVVAAVGAGIVDGLHRGDA